MNFDTTPICKCQNDECGQEFNQDNIKLAVCLYGVIFLVRIPSPQENDGKGFVGLTCPKCLRHSLYTKTYQEVLQIKERLTSWVEVQKDLSVDEEGLIRYEQSVSFEPDMKYYSPFRLARDKIKDFNILTYGMTDPGNNYFSDGLSSYIENNIYDWEERLCSYVNDSGRPEGMSSIIYWYRDEDIESLLKLETEKDIRIFPRYHYYTDLYASIDQLLRFQYFIGQPYEQAKENFRADNQRIKEELRTIAYEKGLNYDMLLEENNLNNLDGLIRIIETNQKSMAEDPKILGEFLDVLISEPSPLGGRSLQGHCDYLWSGVDLFHKNEFPNSFVASVESAGIVIKEMKEGHSKKVSLVKKNFTKQYVQEFLRDNLIDFLEKYEGLIQSNTFSYAVAWELKEEYLERLHEVTNQGLGLEKPFTFHYVGPGWTIRFNNNFISGLRDSGLQYVYFLLSHPNEYFSYFDLDMVGGIDPSQCYSKEQHTSGSQGDGNNNAKKPTKTIDVNDMMDDEGYKSFKEAKIKLEQSLLEAKQNNDIPRIQIAEQELDDLMQYLQEYYISCRKKKKTFPVKEAKNRYDRIEKSISRAIKKIEGHNPDLYLHLSQSIYGLSNKFYRNAGLKKLSAEGSVMYRPDPNIEWHLY